MKTLVVGTLLASAATVAAQDRSSVPPRLAVEVDMVDFGEIRRGEVVRSSFEIRNVGGQDLRILEAKPG